MWTQLTENPDPEYTFMIRFSARIEHRVTVVDVEPFYILNEGVDVDEKGLTNIPSYYELKQNYPNPFNPSTIIKYTVPKSSRVTITVFDILGNKLETLTNEEKPAGAYELTWSAYNLPSGVYFYKLRTGKFIQTKKMLLLK